MSEEISILIESLYLKILSIKEKISVQKLNENYIKNSKNISFLENQLKNHQLQLIFSLQNYRSQFKSNDEIDFIIKSEIDKIKFDSNFYEKIDKNSQNLKINKNSQNLNKIDKNEQIFYKDVENRENICPCDLSIEELMADSDFDEFIKENSKNNTKENLNFEPKTPKNNFITAFEKLNKENSKLNNWKNSKFTKISKNIKNGKNSEKCDEKNGELMEELKGFDEKLIEIIKAQIMTKSPDLKWDEIIGLDFQKRAVQEIVIWPVQRPDIFKGLREPPKGILLFGPPGTGKTMIGKAIASEAGAKFFCISASSLTSKWHGEGEKLVKALFAVASSEAPAIIFIDEIDSLLSQRSSSDFEASTRMKTEFLVQLDGVRGSGGKLVLLIGATNRPQEIDEAARRRLSKRLYIPLPTLEARKKMIKTLLKKEENNLNDDDFNSIAAETKQFSGADVVALCREASYGPIRCIKGGISGLKQNEVRNIDLADFRTALKMVKPSVSELDIKVYQEWNKEYGCAPIDT